MNPNLPWVTLYFCGGIILGHFARVEFWLVYALAITLFAACLLSISKEFIFKVLFSCLAFSLGALLLKNACTLASFHISNYIFYKNKTIYAVKGFINSQPRFNNTESSFRFAARELQFDGSNYKCSGDIFVHLRGREKLSYGEVLILRGKIHKPFKFYSGSPPAVMYVDSAGLVVNLRKNCGQPLRKLALYLKDRIEAIIYQRLSSLTASILDAMVLGERKNIPAIIYDSMIRSGTVHILVVSGFNVGVVAFIIMLLLKIMRLPPRPRYGLAIFCLIIYCLMTGASPPVIRATVMAVFMLTGFWLRREPGILNSLCLAGLFILFLNPRELFSISFQLSFVSVAAIVFAYPALKRLVKADSIKIRPLKFIAEGCLVSLSAWLGTFGLILYYFKVFSPITVLANIFIVPIATLITLTGFSLVIISLVLPFCAALFSYTSEFLVVLLLKVNNFLIQLPFACLYL